MKSALIDQYCDSPQMTSFPAGNDLGEEGLYYFNARWYDASLGRFITADPVKDGVNWIVYVANNPMTFIDHTGLYIVRDTYKYSFYMQYKQNKDNGEGKPKGQQYGSSGYVHSSGCAITFMAKAISAITGNLLTPEVIADNENYFDGNNINWGKVAGDYGLEAKRVGIEDMSYDAIKDMIETAETSSDGYAYGLDLKYDGHSHFVNAIGTEEIGGKEYVEIDPTSINDVAGIGSGERAGWLSIGGKIYVPIGQVQDLIEVKKPYKEPDPYRNGMNDKPSGNTGGSGNTGDSGGSGDTDSKSDSASNSSSDGSNYWG